MCFTKLEHRFVQYIPEQLDPGVLYISMEYATAAHSCCCGCGLQVITPFTPTDWKLTFDGDSVSLWPSIGNWNFPCRSHYIIRRSRIIGAGPWDEDKVEEVREEDHEQKAMYFAGKINSLAGPPNPEEPRRDQDTGLWERIRKKVRKSKRQR